MGVQYVVQMEDKSTAVFACSPSGSRGKCRLNTRGPFAFARYGLVRFFSSRIGVVFRLWQERVTGCECHPQRCVNND